MDTIQAQFSDIVVLINYSRNNAIRHVNAELINLYWNVGAYISKKIASASWGEGTVEELAAFIQLNYPEIKGFNKRGLYRMRQFYETYLELAVVSPLVAQSIRENYNAIETGFSAGENEQTIINKEDIIVSTVLTQLPKDKRSKNSRHNSAEKKSQNVENNKDTIVSTVLTQLDKKKSAKDTENKSIRAYVERIAQGIENKEIAIVSTVLTQLDISDIRESVLAKIGWSQHLLLLSRCKTNFEREFYLKLCIKEKYTVRELDRQISASYYERSIFSEPKASKSLKEVVPDISRHFKDKYVFEFLNLPEPYNEPVFCIRTCNRHKANGIRLFEEQPSYCD